MLCSYFKANNIFLAAVSKSSVRSFLNGRAILFNSIIFFVPTDTMKLPFPGLLSGILSPRCLSSQPGLITHLFSPSKLISLALLLLNTPHDLQASIVIAVEAVARGALVVDLLFLAVLVEAADAAFFLFFAGMV